MDEPRSPESPETQGVIAGEPGDDGIGLVVTAAEIGEPLDTEYWDAEHEPIPGLDEPDWDMSVLLDADRLTSDGEEPLPEPPSRLAFLPASAVRRATVPVLTGPQYRTILVRLGWRVRNTSELAQAVRLFQRAWALGPPLKVDGKVGPLTSAALRISEARRVAGQGTASQHFSFREFACKCGGRYSACARVWVVRLHVLRLEEYRQKIGRPVSIVSGCRCVQHNKAVGGASSSQHLYGVASDIRGVVTDSTLRRWGLFAGLGWSRSTHRVQHVDSRDVGGRNATAGTLAHPTSWAYAR